MIPMRPITRPGEAFDLAEDKTLKGYGRRGHGLNGKDADLDECGQNAVTVAVWDDADTIHIQGRRYASLVPDENWSEEQTDLAQEIVSGAGYPGEWDGDYWILSEPYSLTVSCVWNDDESEEQNIERACKTAYDAIAKDSEAFEAEMAALNKAFEEIE